VILYYAVGGGLGHLARASAFLFTQKMKSNEVILLTASPYTHFEALPKGLTIIQISSKLATQASDYQQFLEDILQKHQITDIYLDAFPVGIVGEWKSFFKNKALRFYYLVRLLDWGNYEGLLTDTKVYFEKSFYFESLLPIQEDFIRNHSKEIKQIKLSYPEISLNLDAIQLISSLKKEGKKLWLVIHSEPVSELQELLEYAQASAKIEKESPVFLIISQVRLSFHLEDIHYIEVFPSCFLLEKMDRIVTACGFNLMQQTLPFYQKHLYLPFPRRYDLQFERARQRRNFIKDFDSNEAFGF